MISEYFGTIAECDEFEMHVIVVNIVRKVTAFSLTIVRLQASLLLSNTFELLYLTKHV